MKATMFIETALRNGQTYLKNCYHSQPFKIMDITEDKSDSILHLMQMNASPGVLDGDEYEIKINLATSSSLHLHTQSYQRLFHMKEKASQRMTVCMGEGSFFYFLPHPMVPHKKSFFKSSTQFFLTKGCTLLCGEVLTCGRKWNGESFDYSSFASKTEIFIENKLVVKELLQLQPHLIDVNAIGQLENFTHQATLIYMDEKAIIKNCIASLIDLSDKKKDLTCGVSALPVNGLIVRLLGTGAEQLHVLLKQMAACLQSIQAQKQLTSANENLSSSVV